MEEKTKKEEEKVDGAKSVEKSHPITEMTEIMRSNDFVLLQVKTSDDLGPEAISKFVARLRENLPRNVYLAVSPGETINFEAHYPRKFKLVVRDSVFTRDEDLNRLVEISKEIHKHVPEAEVSIENCIFDREATLNGDNLGKKA